ncbi:MAG: SEC-C domain-containing protein, partial [Comamonas sp.]|uniref:SEC-C metal-binding domain-containing protein n=1 Tax=Comamonas sp. TaxID=34028 RepID=UPI00282FC86E
LMTVRIQQPEALQQAAQGIEQHAEQVQGGMHYASADADKSDAGEAFKLPEGVRVGRNDPCPCGSGEKFKNCHGKLA